MTRLLLTRHGHVEGIKPARFRGQGTTLTFIFIVFLIAVVAGIVQRSPYIGALMEGHHQWLTAEQIKFVEYWDSDGWLTDRLLTIESPRSIESATIEDRGVYNSFPPGGTVQIYLLHRLLPTVALPTLISLYGIGLQALIALTIGLLVRRMIAPPDRARMAVFFVFAAMLTYLFHPAPYYFHSMVQFGYQSTLLPFSIALFLEYELRTRADTRLMWLQTLIIGWMAALDWLFAPFGIALSLFRLISPLSHQYRAGLAIGLLKTMCQIWLAGGLVCLTFVWNLHDTGQLADLVSRAALRTGLDSGVEGSVPLTACSVYQRFFVQTLGYSRIWLAMAAAINVAFVVRNRRDAVAVVCCIALLTPCLYIALLPNDSVTHDFSALKFYVPLSLVAFGITPYRVIWRLSGKMRHGAFGLMAFLWAFYLIHYRTNWNEWYQDMPPATQKLAEWLRPNARFEEVYLSDSLEIPDNPPVPVAISRKRVWLLLSGKELRIFVALLPPAAKIRFLSKTDYGACFDGASPSRLPDGTYLYFMDTWPPDRINCLAEHWRHYPGLRRSVGARWQSRTSRLGGGTAGPAGGAPE